MKSKKEFLLLGIVIIALAAYLLTRKTDQTHYELPSLPALGKSDITSLKITKGKDTVELKKADDKWLILPEKYPADTTKIDPMLKVVKELSLTALVAESQADRRYDLDPENRITVAASAEGKTVRSFDIGKAAPSGRHTFVKLPDDKRVYHAGENFRYTFDQTKDNLRDKTVLKVDRNTVQQVDITDKDGKSVLSLKQVPKAPAETSPTEPAKDAKDAKNAAKPPVAAPKEMVWKDGEGKDVQESDINNLFNNLSHLQCQSFINGKTKADFTTPLYTVSLTGVKTATLTIYDKLNKDDDTYPAVSSESDYPFMLPAYKLDDMVKKKDAPADTPAAAPAPASEKPSKKKK